MRSTLRRGCGFYSSTRLRRGPWHELTAATQTVGMVGIAVLILLIGLVLLLLGVFVKAVGFLLWLGVVLIVIAIIAALIRFIRRQV
jgi:hypothetical protein